MSDLDALLAGIVADPHNALRWLIVADWLDDHGQSERAELLRLHRELIRTCCEPDAHPERAEWQARIVELIDQGVKPCVPQHTLMLPGGVPLVGNFIPPGSFLMGSEEGEDNERPVHKVTITKGFFMGIHPVTQEQWQAVMPTVPSEFKGDMLPVECVSWHDAQAFCDTASQVVGHPTRLATEAEWEYACRAGTTTRFHWGDMPDERRRNSRHESKLNGLKRDVAREPTSEVGTYAANPLGLFDCHGNVWEWCQDWWDDNFYSRSLESDPVAVPDPSVSDDDYYILRGCS